MPHAEPSSAAAVSNTIRSPRRIRAIAQARGPRQPIFVGQGVGLIDSVKSAEPTCVQESRKILYEASNYMKRCSGGVAILTSWWEAAAAHRLEP